MKELIEENKVELNNLFEEDVKKKYETWKQSCEEEVRDMLNKMQDVETKNIRIFESKKYVLISEFEI
jgi:hypothetical protein